LEKQIAEAEAKKEHMIQEARQEAVKLIHDGEAGIDKQFSLRVEQAKDALNREKERIIQDKSKDTEQVKAYAVRNFDRTIPLVLDIFERSVNAETPKDE
jgi:V/A-type H+-transporting ATPase subunit G/H